MSLYPSVCCCWQTQWLRSGEKDAINNVIAKSAFLAKVAFSLNTFSHLPHPAPPLTETHPVVCNQDIYTDHFFFSCGLSPQCELSWRTGFKMCL